MGKDIAVMKRKYEVDFFNDLKLNVGKPCEFQIDFRLRNTYHSSFILVSKQKSFFYPPKFRNN
jgi:hypothetical protein